MSNKTQADYWIKCPDCELNEISQNWRWHTYRDKGNFNTKIAALCPDCRHEIAMWTSDDITGDDLPRPVDIADMGGEA